MQNYFRLFVAVSCLIGTSAHATSGGIDAGGGDVYAAEFAAIAHQLISIVKDTETSLVDAAALEEAVAATEVLSHERVYLNGVEKDAINYPSQKRIEIGRVRWDAIEDDVLRKYRLVLHEYLGILRVNDGDYRISAGILDGLKKPIASISCLFRNPLEEKGSSMRYRITGTAYANHPAAIRGIIPAQLGMKIYTDKAFFRYGKRRAVQEAAFANRAATFIFSLDRKPKKDKLILIQSGRVKEAEAQCKSAVHGVEPRNVND